MGCNLYTAAFLLPKTGEVPGSDSERTVPTSQDVWLAVGQGKGRKPIMENAKAASQARALHWPLEFPDIMGRGGFDVVLGNPPWERIKLQEKEFFAARDPEIATAPTAAARRRRINALQEAASGTRQRALWDEFQTAKRLSEALSVFVRIKGDEGGRFPFTGAGDVNTYALFAELFAGLAGPKGRAGVIVPTGVATDATTAPFFAHLVEEKRLAGILDFENSAPTFPAVHRSFKFCLLTLGRNEPKAHFAFFLTETAQLAEPERNFTLSPEQIAAINPNTKTAPVFRSRWDAELTAKIYRNAPILIEEAKGRAGNPWGVSFMTMFHMSNDSGSFRTAAQLSEAGYVQDGAFWTAQDAQSRQGTLAAEVAGAGALHLQNTKSGSPKYYVPLYEAKMIHQFDHRWAGFAKNGTDSADIGLAEKADPAFEPSPRYWVPKAEIDTRLASRSWSRGWLMGLRGIARATDERTIIPSVWPLGGVGNSIHVWTFARELDGPEISALYASLTSLPFDFVARQKVGAINLNFFYVEQFPILPPDFYTEPRLAFITPKVLELTYTSHSLAPFARDIGYDGPPFAWDEDRRALLRAELDAFYARAYGLTQDELRYILDPADVKGEDYPSETFRVLKEKEIRQHGEYRTRRLVLEAWDRLEANGDFEAMEM